MPDHKTGVESVNTYAAAQFTGIGLPQLLPGSSFKPKRLSGSAVSVAGPQRGML